MDLTRIVGVSTLIALTIVGFASDAPARGGKSQGALVFARVTDPPGRSSTLQMLDLDSKVVRELSDPKRPVYDVAVAPDGEQVAYVTSSRSGDQIRLVGTDGTGDRSLVNEGLIIDRVSWTPDGTQLVYSAGPFDRRGNRQFKRSELYSVAAEGGEPTRLTRDDNTDFDPSVTPDGERIVFVRNAVAPAPGDDPRLDIHSMALDGSDVQRITNTKVDEVQVEVSPDGKRIAFVRDLGPEAKARRRKTVQVIGIDGSNRVTIERGAGDDANPTWSPDGSRVTFASDRGDRKAASEYFREQLYSARPNGTGVKRLLTSRFGDALPSYVP